MWDSLNKKDKQKGILVEIVKIFMIIKIMSLLFLNCKSDKLKVIPIFQIKIWRVSE